MSTTHTRTPAHNTNKHTITDRKLRKYHVFQYCQVAIKANGALERYQARFCSEEAAQEAQ